MLPRFCVPSEGAEGGGEWSCIHNQKNVFPQDGGGEVTRGCYPIVYPSRPGDTEFSATLDLY